jgi:hypothetical protein
MNRPKIFAATCALSYLTTQLAGLVLVTVWLTSKDFSKLSSLVSTLPMYVGLAFFSTFMFSLAYSVVLSWICVAVKRCRQSLLLSSALSVVLTSVVFDFVMSFKGLLLGMERQYWGLFMCSVVAGLLGNLPIHRYYRRQEQLARLAVKTSEAPTLPGTSPGQPPARQ